MVRPGFDGSQGHHYEKPTLARALLDGGELHLLSQPDLEDIRPLDAPPPPDTLAQLARALARAPRPRANGAAFPVPAPAA